MNDTEPTSAEAFTNVTEDLAALRFAVLSPVMVHTAIALVGQAQRNLTIALEKLDEERLLEQDKAKADNLIYHEWHRRMVAAEAELVTLRHVHRPVEVTP